MAATLTVQTTNRTTGLDLSTATAATGGGDSWANTGLEMLYVKNGSGGSINVTEVLGPNAGGSSDGLVPSSRVVAIAAGASKILGPFATGIYNDVNNLMNVTYSATASVTVMAFKQGP